ncbi:hypothetical protein [Candidatus Liberibacter americanus]|uniref:Uncharacterized protein n=1 Tax=Candidatus Liberibacter americanus str. Sao Paulo TaxID=1261131 RepID=U6B7L5_9HYPH|nr:hypothetical protein [Candidatus Liberibacter americanus]AHA27856.1 hypothetical protein lam_497 [Candidatus Liberibacter americanus str. Sao Paulo]EMS35901.1 hypothetical protein G653_04226 [Candidatus Liberibacter americanus PW_SP]
MKVIEILNTVCDLVGLSRFENIYGNHSDNSALMLSLLQQSGQEISCRVDWPQLLRTIKVESSPFNIPNDFHRPLFGGAVIIDNNRFARPVNTAFDWEIVKNISDYPWYWIDNKVLHISVSAMATLRYFSKNWLIDANNNPNITITSDDDITVLPSHLLIKDIIWRWRRAQGLNFIDQLREFDASIDSEMLLVLGG